MKYILFLQDLEFISRHEARKLLSKAGCRHQPLWLSDKIEIKKYYRDVEIIVIKEHHVPESLLDQFPNVKMLSLAFTGHNAVNKDFFISRGISLYYVPGYATASVSELNIALTLSLLRKIPLADTSIRKGNWDTKVFPGVELANKKVGIIGTGTIGTATAKLFHAFGCEVNGCSRKENDSFKKYGSYLKKIELIKKCNIIIMAMELNSETLDFINTKDFKTMQKDTILINAARNELVNHSALLNALRTKKIKAALDYTNDPHGKKIKKSKKKNEDNYLAELSKLDDVLLTPHIGFKTEEALKRLAEITIENVGHYLKNDSTNQLT
ncbi:MAG TPA: 2-hydroxyacid dehydrogenase [Bacteroidia bacterium]|nr:2-hydroxyacid dehydrogenase [Bacteroidia bacterium]